MRTRVSPLPELIHDQSWRVEETTGMVSVDIINKVMLVPMLDVPDHAGTRLHALGHAKWTPDTVRQDAKAASVELATYMACEDARVNLNLAAVGLRVEQMASTHSSGLSVELKDVANLGIAGRVGTYAAGRAVYKALLAESTGDGYVIPYAKTLEAAVVLQKIIKDAHNDSEEYSRKASCNIRYGKGLSVEGCVHRHNLVLDDEAVAAEALISSMAKEVDGVYKAVQPSASHGSWGVMVIETPPFTRFWRPPQTGIARRPRRASDMGLDMLYMERVYEDAKVFAQRVPRRGDRGTMLLDVSGSMHISNDALQLMVDKFPYGMIACYAGNRRTGILRILARNRRMVAPKDVSRPARGYNVIDGPALDWLGHQPKPRIWVSDGHATYRDDDHSTHAQEDALDICKHYGIQRIPTMEEACKLKF